MKYNKQSGFTLIEMILSLALIALITGILVPAYHLVQSRNDLDMASAIVTQTLYRAQTLSRAMDGDSNWGVYIEQERVILFCGDSYVGRDADFDEVFSISPAIVPSGVQEFVYEKFSGLPLNTGTIIMALNENEFRSLTINEKGTQELSN